MAKKPLKLGETPIKPVTKAVHQPGKQFRKARHSPTSTIFAAILLLIFMVLVYFAGPDVLQPFFQRLVGIVNALLAMLVVVFAIREFSAHHNKVSLPGIGKVRTSNIAGGVVFLLVLAWWLSPAAPIKAGYSDTDLAGLMVEQLQVANLVVVDPSLASLLTPVPPGKAVLSALRVPADANALRRVWKALAEGNYDVARTLVDEVEREGLAEGVGVPLLRAQVEMYGSRFVDAVAWYKNALELEPADEAILCQLALAHAHAADYKEAEKRAKELLEKAQSQGADKPGMLPPLNLLTSIYAMQGKYAQALQMSEQAKPLRESEGGKRNPHAAANINNQGVLYALTSPPNYGGAESQFNLALTEWSNIAAGSTQATLTDADARVAAIKQNMAMIHLAVSRYADAEATLKEALDIRTRTLPAGHPQLAINLVALSKVQRARGRIAEARTLAEQGLAELEAARPARDEKIANKHCNMLAALNAAACVTGDCGSYSKSRRRYFEISSLIRTTLTAGATVPHNFSAVMQNEVARLYIREGQIAPARLEGLLGQAKQASDDAWQILKSGKRLNHPEAAAVMITQARLQVQDKQTGAATKLLDEAQKLLETARKQASGHVESPEAAEILAIQAAALGSSRTLDQAAELYNQAITMLEGLAGGAHPAAACYWQDLGELYLRLEKYDDAERCLERAISTRDKVAVDAEQKPLPHPDTAAALESYARLLDATSREDEAPQHRARAKRIRDQYSKLNPGE